MGSWTADGLHQLLSDYVNADVERYLVRGESFLSFFFFKKHAKPHTYTKKHMYTNKLCSQRKYLLRSHDRNKVEMYQLLIFSPIWNLQGKIFSTPDKRKSEEVCVLSVLLYIKNETKMVGFTPVWQYMWFFFYISFKFCVVSSLKGSSRLSSRRLILHQDQQKKMGPSSCLS